MAQYEVLPQKEVTSTQTGFPKDSVWSVEGGKTVINHNENTSTGNSLILAVGSGGAITGRHGTFLGDIQVTNAGTGTYTISATGVLFDDATSVMATPKHATDQQMTINYAVGGLGQVIIDVLQAGTAVSDSFSVAIYW